MAKQSIKKRTLVSASENVARSTLTRSANILPMALTLICIASFVAPLLAGLPDAGAVVKDSSEPDTRIWTPVFCALSLLGAFAAWLSIGKNVGAEKRDVVGSGLVGIFVLSVVLFVGHWGIDSHFSQRNLDPMLYGTCYWCAIAAFGIAAAIVTNKSRSSVNTLCLCIAAAAGFESTFAINDYLRKTVVEHISNWREFGTSSPDFLAGYLVLTIPITVAAFLTAPSEEGKRSSWLIGLSLLLQLALLPMTGSRTALISLVIGFVILIAGIAIARTKGLIFSQAAQTRIKVIAGIAVLGLAVGAKPLLRRISSHVMSQESYSFDFRKYTWHAAWNLATHRPLGVGPGMFVNAFPSFEIVNFTRLAHNGYLQFLDEFGFIGLALLLVVCIAPLVIGFRYLTAKTDPATDTSESNTNRILTAGLISAVAAGLIQNIMDSDIQTTICGSILFLAIGLIAGVTRPALVLSETAAPTALKFSLYKIISPIAAILACVSVWYAMVGSAESSSTALATSIDPLSGEILSESAWAQFVVASRSRQDLTSAASDALDQLNKAAALEPTSVTYRRIMDIDNAGGQYSQAIQAANLGLQLDPKSLEMLLGQAQAYDACDSVCMSTMGTANTASSGHTQALQIYQFINKLEHSPYGQVRAVPELVEYHFAYADYALGHDALLSGNSAIAIAYLEDARTILTGYLGEDHNMRMITEGRTFKSLNDTLTQLYTSVSDDLSQAYGESGHPELTEKIQMGKQINIDQFQQLDILAGKQQ